MRFKGLDLNLLVALDALLEERNVSVAGSRVCLSQSAMSGALSRLREYFNDELLVSQGRRMLLTPRAESLIAPLKMTLMHIRTTIAVEQDFVPATSRRTLTIAASDYAIAVLLAPATVELAACAPHIRFDFEPVGREAALKLEQGDLDLFVTLNQYLCPDHPRTQLFEDEYVAIAAADNTLIGDSLSAEQYFSLGHVAVRFADAQNPAFEEWFVRAALKPRRVEVVTPLFGNVPLFLVGTNRLATVHRRLAEHFARFYPIRILPVPFDIPRVRQMAQWHELNSHDECIRWAIASLENYAARWLASAPLGVAA